MTLIWLTEKQETFGLVRNQIWGAHHMKIEQLGGGFQGHYIRANKNWTQSHRYR